MYVWYICIYLYVCVCICNVCVYIYISIHTHIYIYTYTYTYETLFGTNVSPWFGTTTHCLFLRVCYAVFSIVSSMRIDEDDEDAEPMEMFSCDILPDVEVAKRVREADQVGTVHAQAVSNVRKIHLC